MEQILKHIAINIKKERCRRGWTQENLAEMSGLSVSFINKIENGQKNISMKSFLKILDALHVSPVMLIQTEEKSVSKKKYVQEFEDLIELLDESEIEYILGIATYQIETMKALLRKKGKSGREV